MPTAAQADYYKQRRERQRRQQRFTHARRAENDYAIQLRKLANQIGALSSIFDPDNLDSLRLLTETLRSYARLIAPWARSTALRMIGDVSRRDASVWAEHGREMGRALRKEIEGAPTGLAMQQLLAEQVTLITSLPIDAAERVHKLALEGITRGSRGQEIVDAIMATGHVTRSHATLIARTETARTASVLTEARARYVGSEGYIWRTSLDSDVRPLHRKLEGRFVRWDAPPIAGEQGERAHAGCIYNCRCFAEVVLPALTRAA